MASIEQKKFQKHFLNISYSDAKKLSSVKYSCLEEIEHRMNVPLAPKYISDLRRGLKEHLNKILFLFMDELKGVPLAYNQIKIISSLIIDDQEFINLDIKVNFIVFKVNITHVLYGTVTKIMDHSFGCIFHNCINGSVRKPRESCLTEEQNNIVKNIKIGDVIFMKVFKVESHNDILFVVSDIAPQHYRRERRNSQSSMDDDVNIQDDEITRETMEDRINNNGIKDERSPEKDDVLYGMCDALKNSSKRKKKKRKIDESQVPLNGADDSTGSSNENCTLKRKNKNLQDDFSPKKKKKKTKNDEILL